MNTKSESEEELLEKEKSLSEPSEEEVKAAEELLKEELEVEAKAEAEKETEKDKEKDNTTVPLSDYTRTKEILFRMTKEIVDDPEKLAELAKSDPKRIERLKIEFPKLFKDVKIPAATVTDEDIQERIDAAVAKQLTSSGKSDALKALQSELKMTDMEFLDIKADISDRAEKLLSIELASNYREAVMLAYKNLSPTKFKEIMSKQVAREILERKRNSRGGSGLSTETKKFSKLIMDNYVKMGFKSPQEMADYQDPKKMIGIFK